MSVERKKLQREKLAEAIADTLSDDIELDSLVEFYKEHQLEIYLKMKNKDLIDAGCNILGFDDVKLLKENYYE